MVKFHPCISVCYLLLKFHCLIVFVNDLSSLHLIGYMFHCKPLYVAIAQRKEDRQAQLQLQYAQRLAGLAGPSTVVLPGGYPPLYYASPTGIVSQVPLRPGMMHQPFGLRPGWRVNGFAPPTRPVFQPSSLPLVCVFIYKYVIGSNYTNMSTYYIMS